MKKLLALLLCAAMLLSVSGAAFAETVEPEQRLMGADSAGIDLSAAYKSRDILNAAYDILGEATFDKNAVTGIGALYDATDLTAYKENISAQNNNLPYIVIGLPIGQLIGQPVGLPIATQLPPELIAIILDMLSASKKAIEKSDVVSDLVDALNTLKSADPTAESYQYGNSYYGLAQKIAPRVVEAYNRVGGLAAQNTEAAVAGQQEGSMTASVMAQVDDIMNALGVASPELVIDGPGNVIPAPIPGIIIPAPIPAPVPGLYVG